MSPQHVKLLLRCSSYLVLSAIFAFSTSLTPTALAQTSDEFSSSELSSSTQLVAATDEGSSSSSSAMPDPAPVAGGGQYDSGYGSHSNFRSHLALEIGAGANGPTGDSSSYITWGGNVTLGAGWRFNPHLSLLIEYQFIGDKLPGRVISQTGADGGNAHIWSFTMAPVVDLFPHRRTDLYVTGGGGFYRKLTSFTNPSAVEYCYYYYCGITVVDQVVGHFSSNQGGWNAGAGITHKIGDMAKLYAEVRYLDVDTPAVTSMPNGLGLTTLEAHTRVIPITFGVRW
jgi:hypothetical protein